MLKKIVLVDDDEAAHIYHKLMIEDAGISLEGVKSFYSVDACLDFLRDVIYTGKPHNWPDYIFVDINMPIKSGYAFIDEFLELSHKFNMPKIYFVSNSRNPNDVSRVNKMDVVKGFETKFLEKEFFEKLD